MIPAWKVTLDAHEGKDEMQDTQVEEIQELKITILMKMKMICLKSKYPSYI